MNEDKKNEKIGRAIVTLGWWIFAAKFLVIVTVIAGVVIYIIGKPLWIAPVIAVVAFIVYRIILRIVWAFIEWASKQ